MLVCVCVCVCVRLCVCVCVRYFLNDSILFFLSINDHGYYKSSVGGKLCHPLNESISEWKENTIYLQKH